MTTAKESRYDWKPILIGLVLGTAIIASRFLAAWIAARAHRDEVVGEAERITGKAEDEK